MKNKNKIIIFCLLILLLFTFAFSFTLGRYHISFVDLYNTFFNHFFDKDNINKIFDNIIFKIRLPRIICAMIIGSSLSVSGSLYQGIFQNPMASPDILGATNAAAFGAALSIYLNFSYKSVQFITFFISFFAVILVFFVANIARGNKILNLILSGLMIGSIFTSMTSYIKLVCDSENTLPNITYWLMGSLQSADFNDIKFIIIPVTLTTFIIYKIRWQINILSLGDEEAITLGVNADGLRFLCIICSTVLTAISVSISGVIGFVGLLIPHIARKFVGNNYVDLIPASIIQGALFLLIIDNISRNLLDIEIPIGILTSLLGAPFLLYLILKNR